MEPGLRQSGGVLQVYQHDLQEFGIGLKKETAAVARLPLSLESTASVAQVPLPTAYMLVPSGTPYRTDLLPFLCLDWFCPFK